MKFLTSSFYENLMMALDTLRSNKLRSFLTIIGVVIGVISVMLISSIISGINVAVSKQVESFGTRSIFLYKMDIGIRTSAPTREERMRKPLTMEDADAIGKLPSIEVAVPFLNITNNFFGQKINVTGKNGKTSTAVQMNGTLPQIEKTTTETLIEGRWFSQTESDEKAKDEVQDLLRIRRNVKFGEKNNFAMETAASLIEQFDAIFRGVFAAMVVISSIALLIGGLGVMNIMLVSVTERTREIGIRKAIGARQTDILLQFLIEAGTLTGFGGIIGLAVGWGLTLLVKMVFPSYVPLWAPIIGFVVSVGIGLVFGLFPAWKAARLDPIEALRYE